MKVKFDLYKELKENYGFAESKSQFGSDMLTRKFEKEIDVAWYGKMKATMEVMCIFSNDHGTVQVNYYQDSFLMKHKVHLNEKRALNAIRETLRLKEYEL